MMKTIISPSLLSANFIDLKSDIEMINKSEADWLHMDIMDGVFVPNISFGFPVLEAEIVYPGHADPEYAYAGTSKEELDAIEEQETRYPEFSNWKELPAWGFYIRHADGIVFDNVKLTVDGEDYRPAIVTDDVNGLRMKNLQINQETAPKGKKQIITKDTKNIKKK